MNKNRNKSFVLSMLMLTGLIATVQTVSASVAGECQQEAKDYGIESELLDDYIKGCIESRGGEDVSNEAPQSDIQPSDVQPTEEDVMNDPAENSDPAEDGYNITQ
jgi:hypothetical protein